MVIIGYLMINGNDNDDEITRYEDFPWIFSLIDCPLVFI